MLRATEDRTEAVDISVIVPAYNARETLARALDSLARQNLARPFEVIVVDDGSIDDTATIAESFGPPVRVVRQENCGPAAARRRGICEARGERIAFLDADDVALPNKLSVLLQALDCNQNVVASFARATTAEGELEEARFLPEDLDDAGIIRDPMQSLLLRGCFVPSMNLMSYRQLLEPLSRGRDHIYAADDYDLILRLATRGSFAFIDEVTLICERRPGGLTMSSGTRQVACAVLAAVDAVSLSGRRDAAVRCALQARIEEIWPWAFVSSVAEGRLRLAASVAMLGILHARWYPSLRRLWWSFDNLLKNRKRVGIAAPS